MSNRRWITEVKVTAEYELSPTEWADFDDRVVAEAIASGSGSSKRWLKRFPGLVRALPTAATNTGQYVFGDLREFPGRKGKWDIPPAYAAWGLFAGRSDSAFGTEGFSQPANARKFVVDAQSYLTSWFGDVLGDDLDVAVASLDARGGADHVGDLDRKGRGLLRLAAGLSHSKHPQAPAITLPTSVSKSPTRKYPTGDEFVKGSAVYRRFQAAYRTDLLRVKPCCWATGVSMPEILIASHIVPVRDARAAGTSNYTDPENGLLLVATVDRLFDRYLITFENDGSVRWANRVPPKERLRLGHIALDSAVLTSARRKYLSKHRKNFDQRNK